MAEEVGRSSRTDANPEVTEYQEVAVEGERSGCESVGRWAIRKRDTHERLAVAMIGGLEVGAGCIADSVV
jgi:hypothetical protein